jgi:hypothetical protein
MIHEAQRVDVVRSGAIVRRRRAFGGLLLGLVCMATCHHERRSIQKGQTMGYKIEYWSNRASDGYATILRVSQGLPATLQIGSNADEPGPNPVGIFRAVSPRAEEEALVQSVRRLTFAPEVPVVPSMPGEVMRRLTVALDTGSEEVRSASESSPATAPFLAAESAAIALARVVRKYPQAALAAQTFFLLDGTKHWAVTLKLTNAGSELVAIPHPDYWENAVSIQVTARRNDVALADLRNTHQRFIELSSRQLVATTPFPKPGPTIPIAPHRDLTFQFAVDVDLSAGHYDRWLSLTTNLLDARGAEIARVELVSAKAQFP